MNADRGALLVIGVGEDADDLVAAALRSGAFALTLALLRIERREGWG
jgi:hypothetical protein